MKVKGFKVANEENIVDRDEYIKPILQEIEKSHKSLAFIIFSPTAIGKSALCKKILFKLANKDSYVRVVTQPLNSNSESREWTYMDLLFNALEKANQNSKYSFDNFLVSNISTLKSILEDVIDNSSTDTVKSVKKTSQIFTKSILKPLFRIGKYDKEKILQNDSLEVRRLKYHYIRHLFKCKKLVINIENMQNIDSQSLNDLRNLANETKNNKTIYLFEYTVVDDKNINDIQKLAFDFSSTDIEVFSYRLEKLDSNYIIDAISSNLLHAPQSYNYNIELVKLYNQKGTGNLRELIDFSLRFDSSKQAIKEEVSPTLENILNLSEGAKGLLSLLINCGGVMNGELLVDIVCLYMNIDNNDFHKLIIELNHQQIVKEDGENIIIEHASIIDEWNNSSFFQIYNNSAYFILEKHFLNNLHKEPGDKWFDFSWLLLLKLYAKFNINRICDIFEYLQQGTIDKISPANAWTYLKDFIGVTKNNIDPVLNIYFWIVRYCFETELYNEGYQCVELMMDNVFNEKKSCLILHKAMFLSALDKHEENLIFINDMLRQYTDNRIILNLKLISLSSYRSLHQLNSCFELHKELLKSKDMRNYPEYFYFYRLCEMYLDRTKSIPFLKKSYRKFLKSGNIIQSGKSLISYSYIMASQGKLKKAEHSIVKAERYLKNKRIGAHMFLVNKAAIKLLRGIANESVWELLSQAELSARVPFDKLAIIVNKLVWCIENNDKNYYKLLINKAEELLEKEPDKHIHGLIYYNIYYLYHELKHPNEVFYYNKAIQLKPYCKPVKARLENKITNETKFALTKPWHVCFLAYWTYDLLFENDTNF